MKPAQHACPAPLHLPTLVYVNKIHFHRFVCPVLYTCSKRIKAFADVRLSPWILLDFLGTGNLTAVKRTNARYWVQLKDACTYFFYFYKWQTCGYNQCSNLASISGLSIFHIGSGSILKFIYLYEFLVLQNNLLVLDCWLVKTFENITTGSRYLLWAFSHYSNINLSTIVKSHLL